MLWQGDVETFLGALPKEQMFDLVITSPPYNIGKPYEQQQELEDYAEQQRGIIEKIVARMRPTGSICWQVGNYVCKGNRARDSYILPLDYVFHPIFDQLGLRLRNRVVWQFGHGLNCRHRFSGRYEVALWYTFSREYKFNLDDVRVPQKYPGKKHYKGPKAGEYSSNPLGKNPSDVWEIPNVKSNHVEKTDHPCQFPVALVERLVLALTDEDDLVFDPFAGAASAGVAAALHNRRFIGCEKMPKYIDLGKHRVNAALAGEAKFRPLNKPIYDHTKSALSRKPQI